MTTPWRTTFVLFSVLLGSGQAISADEDARDVLLLTNDRPILLRLHVRIDGQPYATSWQRYLDRLFVDLDRDGDGILSKAEAMRAPGAAFLRSFLQGGLNLEAASNQAPFAQLDTNHDGCVSRREFDAYYRQIDLGELCVTLVPDRSSSAALTNALFRMLDRDGDGKLSRDELRRASDTLRRVDYNEDEWITPEELLAVPATKETLREPTLESIGFLPRRAGKTTETLS